MLLPPPAGNPPRPREHNTWGCLYIRQVSCATAVQPPGMIRYARCAVTPYKGFGTRSLMTYAEVHALVATITAQINSHSHKMYQTNTQKMQYSMN